MQDVYLLDKNLELVHVFDSYVSLIWSTRYVELGDCELYIPATTEMLQIVKMGYYLKRPDDDMVCVIRKIELTTSEDGNYITITGKDVRTFADQRVICSNECPSSNAEEVIQYLLAESLSDGAEFLVPGRGLYKANGSPLFEFRYLTGLDGTWNATFAHENTGAKIRDILRSLGWGMKFWMKPDDAQRRIWPKVYKGADRAKGVVFSAEYENLRSSDYLLDGQGAENTALVYEQAEEGETIFRFAGSAPGVDRYEKAVKASGLSDTITWADLVAMFPDGTLVPSGGLYDYTVNPAQILAIPGSEGDFGTGWTLQVIDGQPFYVSSGAVTLGTLETNDPQSDTKVTMARILKQLLLRQRGMEQISGRGLQQTFSAVIDPETTFVFRQDFDLGDIVTVRNEYGITLPARIIEVVEVNDANGYSCQPKLETALGADLLTVRVIGGIWRPTYSAAGQIVGHIISKIGLEVPRKENIQIQGANIVYYEISEYGTKATVIIEDISFGATMVAMCCTYIYAGAELGVRTGAALPGDTAGTKQAGAELEITPRLYYEGQSDDAANATLPGRYGVGADPNADSIDAKGAIPAGGVGIGAALPADSISARAGLLTEGVEDGFTARGWLATCVHDEIATGTASGLASAPKTSETAHADLPAGMAFGVYLDPGTLTYQHAIAAGGVEEGLAAAGEAQTGYTRTKSTFMMTFLPGFSSGSLWLNFSRSSPLDIDWGDGTTQTYSGSSNYITHSYYFSPKKTEWTITIYSAGLWTPGTSFFPFVDENGSVVAMKKAWIGANCNLGKYINPKGTKFRAAFEFVDFGTITALAESLFEYTNLKTVTIPGHVTYIGAKAFQYCAALEEVTIEGSPTIANNFLLGCTGLQRVYCLAAPPTLSASSITGWPANTEIYVLPAYLETYKTAQYWSARAAHILPIE